MLVFAIMSNGAINRPPIEIIRRIMVKTTALFPTLTRSAAKTQVLGPARHAAKPAGAQWMVRDRGRLGATPSAIEIAGFLARSL